MLGVIVWSVRFLAFGGHPVMRRRVQASGLRIALFSGNYNYVRDGANQALNRLVGYLLRKGAKVRIYSPVAENPAFPPTGDLVNVESVPIPFRDEYRITLGLSGETRRDLAQFNANVVHIASPDPASLQRATAPSRRRPEATL